MGPSVPACTAPVCLHTRAFARPSVLKSARFVPSCAGLGFVIILCMPLYLLVLRVSETLDLPLLCGKTNRHQTFTMQAALRKSKESYDDSLEWKLYEARTEHAKELSKAGQGQAQTIEALMHDLEDLRARLHDRVRAPDAGSASYDGWAANSSAHLNEEVGPGSLCATAAFSTSLLHQVS
jgi:hypothetical protein